MAMRKRQFVFNATWLMNRTNQSECMHIQKPCLDTTAMITCLSLFSVLGVASNVLLLYSDYKQWKKRKTPDKVLICNISIANLAALLISMPIRAVNLSQESKPIACGRPSPPGLRAHSFSLAIFTLSCVATLAILGVDRLDALTKFAHQRKLNVKKATIASVLIWVGAVVQPLMFRSTMPLIVSIWIVIGCAILVTCLVLATRRIRKHRQEIVQMFGARQARAEIKFTKTVVALCFCYAVFTLPHLIVFFRFMFQDLARNRVMKCAIFFSTTMVYLSFTLIPVVYFAMDHRMLPAVFPILAASSTSTSNTSSTRPDEKKHGSQSNTAAPPRTETSC